MAESKPPMAPELGKMPESDDPMEMRAAAVDGNPYAMLDGIVEEYARMGWGRKRILELFDSSFFQATHGLVELLGRERVEQRIDAVLARCGVHRFRTDGDAE